MTFLLAALQSFVVLAVVAVVWSVLAGYIGYRLDRWISKAAGNSEKGKP